MTRIVDPLLKRSKVLELHYINYQLIKSLYEYKLDKKKSYQIKTQSRSSIILPYFNNLIVYVYNGKKYIPFKVTKDYIGHKFGEFIYTRQHVTHKKQGKKLMFKKKITQTKPIFKHKKKLLEINSFFLQKKQLKTFNCRFLIENNNNEKTSTSTNSL
jgi:small subunit ribosomal protein S19